ncbi:non-ribosomal peptide synthetase, partial [Collimonas pratensis]|uniref:condensation domain-containing protein n=1 Tax=Collimonas pratensis TaxID=279113 RepID=UPI001980F244
AIRAAFDIDFPLRILFDHPSIAPIAAQIEIARLEHDGRAHTAVIPVARGATAPTSFAQQRLWFLDQLEPRSAFYNMSTLVRLIGVLDVVALRATLNEIVRRHESLRTTLATQNGNPVQFVNSNLTLLLPVIDLTGLSNAEREEQKNRLAQDEARMPFDLAIGPLIRVRLIRLGEAEYVVLFTLHHIVSDGWSMDVLIREVVTLYTAYIHGKSSPLPELPIQYADFSHWQRQWLSGPVLQNQLAYWQRQLAGAPALLTLPTDRPRLATASHRGASLPFVVVKEIRTGLYALSQQHQTTLFMMLTAAFSVLLSRYSGQSDICIGSPIANRNRSEIASLIGFFVNTLVLRSQVNANDRFVDLLQQIRTTALSAYANQDVPFEHLVEVLKPERHSNHHPLF